MKKIICSSIFAVLVFAGVVAGKEPSDLQKNFSVSEGGKLVVSINGGDIQVKVWDKLQVQMTAQDIGDDADLIETSQDGNTINVRTRGGWWSGSRDLRFIFYVPTNFNLNLSTSGGDLELGGELTGDVELSTSGGDVTIEDVNGTVAGKTSGGDMVAHNLEKDATLSTSGGDIRVDHAGNNLDISTSGGDITIGTVAKNLDASTAGGDIDISKVGGELHASTSSGNLTIGKVGGSVSVSTSGGDISLTSGNGRITANTSGGDIEIKTATGSVDISSSGGTITVGLVPKGDEESKVESSCGDVYLYIPSDVKANIKAEVFGGEDSEIFNGLTGASFKMSTGYGKKEADFVINGGGQPIYLRTSSGNIYVKDLNSFSK
ncbi:MAG TPA: DUF4097 family beta strand repeat-containing protein [Candidatus Acidoferrales bacterium]|nr:DUF4097 family beta strand repeat-containing protein [Candidatus Acidoferrales bacterium]